MGELIKGKDIARGINVKVKEQIFEICSAGKRRPRLMSLLASDSRDAKVYVNMQKRAAEDVGIEFFSRELGTDVSQEDIIEVIKKLNSDKDVTAVILQKPLPDNIDHSKVISELLPAKDAEGVHPYNLGKILRREADIVPCTPGAVMKILSVLDADLYGKEVVIIGNSAIIGKPLSLMLTNEMATTTLCHIGTSEKGMIKQHTRRADILIVAAGKAELVKGDWVKDGAIVIDVGINHRDTGEIVGDVDFKEVSLKAAHITPVPGGVGPITVSILMRNVLRAFMAQDRK